MADSTTATAATDTSSSANGTTLADLDAQIAALKKQATTDLEKQRLSRLDQARGLAIARGLSGSTMETQMYKDVNDEIDKAINDSNTSIDSQNLSARMSIQSQDKQIAAQKELTQIQNDYSAQQQDLQNKYNDLEQQKQNAFTAGENDKANNFAAQQAELQRQAEEAQARAQGRAQLINQGLLGLTLAAVTPAPQGQSVLDATASKVGSIFGAGKTETPTSSAVDATGKAVSSGGDTFMGSLSKPLSTGLADTPSGMGGQVLGSAASIYGGADLGQKMSDSIFGQSYNNDKSISRGGKTGSLLGAGVGTYFGGPLGGLAGGALGGVVGSEAGKALRGLAGGNAITFSNVGSNISKQVKSIFCFLGETPVEMASGEAKPISEIVLGEETLGGKVLSVRKSICNDLYFYNGIGVAGSHAVKEDKKWLRVKDSPSAEKIEGIFEVYCLVTTKHRIFVLGTAFADEHETDDYEQLTIDQSLEMLNLEEKANG